MAIAHVQTVSANTLNSSQLTVTGVTEGNALIVLPNFRGTTGASTLAVSSDQDGTMASIRQRVDGPQNGELSTGVGIFVLTGVSAGTHVFSSTGDGTSDDVTCIEVSGLSAGYSTVLATSTAGAVDGDFTDTATATPNTGDITISDEGIALCIGSHDVAGAAVTAGTSWTEAYESSAEYHLYSVVNGGATLGDALTINTARDHAGICLALTNGGGGGGGGGSLPPFGGMIGGLGLGLIK